METAAFVLFLEWENELHTRVKEQQIYLSFMLLDRWRQDKRLWTAC
jgi:hypothetical protein